MRGNDLTQHDAEARNNTPFDSGCAHHLAILHPDKRIEDKSNRCADAESGCSSCQEFMISSGHRPYEQHDAEGQEQVRLEHAKPQRGSSHERTGPKQTQE